MTRPVFSNLCIGHLNVRGLEHHIDGVKLLLDNNKYHIFAVTETKLRSSAPMGPIRVPESILSNTPCLPTAGVEPNLAEV